MTRLNDADLMATLTAALAPPPASPNPADRARLRLLLVDAEPVAPIIPLRTRRRNLASRVRHPVAAAAVVVVLATSSAAAAAVGTDTLPGPLRTVAVSLGLPVPSPALNTARGAMASLAAALGSGDEDAIARDLTALQAALSKLDPADLASVKEAADQLVDRADLALASGSTQLRSVGGAPGDGRGGSGKGTSGDTGTSTSGDGGSGDGGSGGGPGPSGTQSGSTSGSSDGGGGPGPSVSGGGSPGSDGDSNGPSSPLQGTSGAPSDGGGASTSGSPGGSSDGAGSGGGGSSSIGSGTSGSGGGGSGGPGDSGGGPG